MNHFYKWLRCGYVFLLFPLFNFNQSYGQKSDLLRGQIVNSRGGAVENANIILQPVNKSTLSNKDGFFEIQNVAPGKYTLKISHVRYQPLVQAINFENNNATVRVFTLADTAVSITDVEIIDTRAQNNTGTLPDVQGTYLFAGKKNEVIQLQQTDADLAQNNTRQMFAKIPGVMVWELDGTGSQMNISTRGVNAHRMWEMNANENGNIINSDLYGYPEAHYGPPAEAIEKIEIVRGSAALQYGPQYGGMINFVIKQADTLKKFSFQTQQSVGSFGLFSSFNALGGRVGKFTYYGYYDFRRQDGWRKNSDYNFNAWHISLGYQFTSKINLSAELSHMDYVNHFSAGLTDSMFNANPQQSNRSRNYFNPTIYVPALHLTIKATATTLITLQGSAILGQRNSVQLINLPTINDTINKVTNAYNPRQVDRDYYHSYYAQARILQNYYLLHNTSYLAAGFMYGNTDTWRKQLGKGTTGSDFDLSLTAPYATDLKLRSTNYALFAENTFNFTKNFSVTPGVRFEALDTKMSGKVSGIDSTKVPYQVQRYFILAGIGLQYKITPVINAYADFTQNYRPIAYSDIIPASPLYRTNPNLQDSKGGNAEVGIRGEWKNIIQWDVNYFLLLYNNRIGTISQTDSTGTYIYTTNVGNMTNQGAEIFIEIHPFNLLGRKARFYNFGFYTSTAFSSAHYTKGNVVVSGVNKDIKGNEAENIPQWISRNGINYTYKSLSAAFQFSYVAKCFSDALNTVSTASGINGIIPAYFLADFNVSYTFLKKYNIKASVNNIADKHYFTRRATNYPGPGVLPGDGRAFVISFGANF